MSTSGVHRILGRLGLAEPRKVAGAVTRPRPANTSPAVTPPAPRIVDRAARRSELIERLQDVQTDEEAAAAWLALLRHDTPEVDRWLNAGASLVDALISSDHAAAVCCLRKPEDFAALALGASESPDLGPGEGESVEAFARWGKEQPEASRARAIALLSAALEIVRGSAA